MARATWLAGLLALALSACAETRSAQANGNGGNANPPDSLERVLSRTFTVPAFKLESGAGTARADARLRDVRPARAGRPQRDPRDARLHEQPPRGRQVCGDRPDGGLVGRAHRPGQGARHRPLLRRVVQHARLLVRIHGAGNQEPKDRQAVRSRLPGDHPARHRRRAEDLAGGARRPASRRRRGAVVRRLSGVSVGGRPIPRS